MLRISHTFAQDEQFLVTMSTFSIPLSSCVHRVVLSAAPSLTRFARFALPAVTATTKMRSRVPRAKRGPTNRVGEQ